MNYRRVLVLGLLLGVYLNVVGVLGNGVLLRDAWATAIPERPALAMTGWMSIIVSHVSDFVFGLALVWLYGAMIPRLGAGFRTALWSASVVWLLGVAVPYLGIVRIGWLPTGIVAATSLVALVGFVPAAWATCQFYRDAR